MLNSGFTVYFSFPLIKVQGLQTRWLKIKENYTVLSIDLTIILNKTSTGKIRLIFELFQSFHFRFVIFDENFKYDNKFDFNEFIYDTILDISYMIVCGHFENDYFHDKFKNHK